MHACTLQDVLAGVADRDGAVLRLEGVSNPNKACRSCVWMAYYYL
jgi:hypothetical protein